MIPNADRIKHLILLMMENRSFDHYLGSLTLEGRKDIEGLPSPLPAVKNRADRRAQIFDTLVALEQSVVDLKRMINV